MANDKTADFLEPIVRSGMWILGSPSEEEWKVALASLNNGKASGPDKCPAELLKLPGMARLLADIFGDRTYYGNPPEIACTSTTIPIYKSKGNVKDLLNYRQVTLMCIAAKAYHICLLNRFRASSTDHASSTEWIQNRKRNSATYLLS